MAKITITTSTETLQLLEDILQSYENALDDHLYRIFPESSTRQAQGDIATMRAEMNRMIGQAERQIEKTRPDLSGVHD